MAPPAHAIANRPAATGPSSGGRHGPLGALRRRLLGPEGPEREGYVPNVVYSCGSMLNGRDLILPYGMSDGAVGIAVVSVPDLLTALRAGH